MWVSCQTQLLLCMSNSALIHKENRAKGIKLQGWRPLWSLQGRALGRAHQVPKTLESSDGKSEHFYRNSYHYACMWQNAKGTRMHSSGMRTARSSGRPGGLHQTPPWSRPPGAGTHPPEQAPPKDQTPQSSHPPGSRHPPPMNRMTDRCKNITLPQTSFAGGN